MKAPRTFKEWARLRDDCAHDCETPCAQCAFQAGRTADILEAADRVEQSLPNGILADQVRALAGEEEKP